MRINKYLTLVLVLDLDLVLALALRLILKFNLMKHLLLLSTLVLLSSFNSDDKESNDVDRCNQSFTIDGGSGCNYNGTTHGWCSQAEFDEYANNVYSLEECGGDGYNPAPDTYIQS